MSKKANTRLSEEIARKERELSALRQQLRCNKVKAITEDEIAKLRDLYDNIDSKGTITMKRTVEVNVYLEDDGDVDRFPSFEYEHTEVLLDDDDLPVGKVNAFRAAQRRYWSEVERLAKKYDMHEDDVFGLT